MRIFIIFNYPYFFYFLIIILYGVPRLSSIFLATSINTITTITSTITTTITTITIPTIFITTDITITTTFQLYLVLR